MSNTYLCLNCGQTIIGREYRYLTCTCGHCEPCSVHGGRFYKAVGKMNEATIEEIGTNAEGEHTTYTVMEINSLDQIYACLSDIPIAAAQDMIDFLAENTSSVPCNEFAKTLDKACHILKHYYLYANSDGYRLLIDDYPELYPMAAEIIKSRLGFPDATSMSTAKRPIQHKIEDVQIVLDYLKSLCPTWDGYEQLIAYSYLINNFNPKDIDIFVKTGISLDMFNQLTRTQFSLDEVKQYAKEAYDDGYYGESITNVILAYNSARVVAQMIDPHIFDKLCQKGTVCTKLFILQTYLRKCETEKTKHKNEIALAYNRQTKIEIEVDFDLILKLATPEEAIEYCHCIPSRDAIIKPVYELYDHGEFVGLVYFGLMGIYNTKVLDNEIKIKLNNFLDREEIINGSVLVEKEF